MSEPLTHLQVDLVELLLVRPFQQLSHLGRVGPPPVRPVLPLPHHHERRRDAGRADAAAGVQAHPVVLSLLTDEGSDGVPRFT